jgi:hypothetical protein
MEDPELRALAWRLHSLYPHALEYLRKDEAMPLGQIAESLVELIKAASPEMAPYYERKLTPDDLEQFFVPAEWETISRLRSGGASREIRTQDRLLVFWFGIYTKSAEPRFHDLVLYLSIAPAGTGTLMSTHGKPGSSRNRGSQNARSVKIDETSPPLATV